MSSGVWTMTGLPRPSSWNARGIPSSCMTRDSRSTRTSRTEDRSTSSAFAAEPDRISRSGLDGSDRGLVDAPKHFGHHFYPEVAFGIRRLLAQEFCPVCDLCQPFRSARMGIFRDAVPKSIEIAGADGGPHVGDHRYRVAFGVRDCGAAVDTATTDPAVVGRGWNGEHKFGYKAENATMPLRCTSCRKNSSVITRIQDVARSAA